MTDNELIKMCDCLEIQGRWEPKFGDICMYRKDKANVIGYTDGILSIRREHTGDYLRTDKAIFIPRIEDVLEWVEGQFDMLRRIGPKVWDCHLRHPVYKTSDTPIKALLKAYMHIEHGKEWDGGWRAK